MLKFYKEAKFIIGCLCLFTSSTTSLYCHSSMEEFKKELGLQLVTSENKPPASNVCKMYLVHHGSTEWSEIERLQGWRNVPLSARGREQIVKLIQELAFVKMAAIYSSPLQSAAETSEMLKSKFCCPLLFMDDLRGEFHGLFDGYYKEQYQIHPHFQFYDSLSAEEEMFFPCGPGGQSKAEIALRIVSLLKKIAEKHYGESIVAVSHGGIFAVLNYYLGNYSKEHGLIPIPNGTVMIIEADENTLYLKSSPEEGEGD